MSVTIKTNLGDLKAELYCQQAPKTCKNFLALCASDYYNGTLFHRGPAAVRLAIIDICPQGKGCCFQQMVDSTNIKGFAIQGGDPSGTGKGGESIYGGFFEDEFVSTLKHDRRGVLSMANQGKPNTNGSQFFITYSRQPHLNGVYTVFGRLIDGMDTLDKMEREPVGRKNRPENNIVIQKVIIHANPIAEAEQL